MRASVQAALGAALGSEPRQVRPVSGGDINRAWRVGLADGREVFAKTHPGGPDELFPKEARGLAWLAEPDVIAVPDVLAVAGGPCGFLALELVQAGPRVPDFQERLGRQLAALHRASPGAHGLDHDNFIGPLVQPNTPATTWAGFYRDQRLRPRIAGCGNRLPTSLRHRLDRLLEVLPELVGPPEPPARLHGDLWGGNLMTTAEGLPCLIDPAVAGGHRELDLAMMRLFGGFDDRCFAAYDEACPLSPGAAERVPLYQLYFLLVHVELFGRSYVSGVASAVSRYV